MLRALIIKHLEGIKSVPFLIDYLNSKPPLLEMCGFELGNLPDETQFYRFGQKTKNSTLKDIHKKANDLLIQDAMLPNVCTPVQAKRGWMTNSSFAERLTFQRTTMNTTEKLYLRKGVLA